MPQDDVYTASNQRLPLLASLLSRDSWLRKPTLFNI